MIPMQSQLPQQDGPARGPVLSSMQVVRDAPAPDGSGPPRGFAGVMSRQPSEPGEKKDLDQPSAPDQTSETGEGETAGTGAAVSEDPQLERGASAMELPDGAVRSPAAEMRAPENRSDGKAHDPVETEVKAPRAGERPPRAPTDDISLGPPRAQENPPGPGLAATPGIVDGASRSGHVDGAPMAGRVPLQEGSASASSGRQPGAAHPPLSGAEPMHPRADHVDQPTTQAGHVRGRLQGVTGPSEP